MNEKSNIDKKISYWLELSDYDTDTAKVMFEGKKYLYVGFMCHMATEKALKAYYQYIKNEIPPKTHNLLLLSSETGLLQLMSEKQIDFLTKLNPLNVEARYPEYKERIFKSLDEIFCKDLIKQTDLIQKWIKEKL